MEEECRRKRQTLQRTSISSRGRGMENEGDVPPIVNEVLRSPGQPLDKETRSFFEPRFGHDFSKVRLFSDAQSPATKRTLTVGPSESEHERHADDMAETVSRQPVVDFKPLSTEQTASRCMDLGDVRVHTDGLAARSAQAINALAYTVGRDIVFNTGQYAPNSNVGRQLVAHELTHVIQQSQSSVSRVAHGPATVQRKVIVKGVEMPSKVRAAFLKARKWTNPALAQSIMEDMATAGDVFDFADETELQSEILKRLSTVRHMEESQADIPMHGAMGKAFAYPFNESNRTELYGPRVNFAARTYWEPAVPDGYANRDTKANKSTNRALRDRKRSERYVFYGDPGVDYGWKLSTTGKKDPYQANALLFRPQTLPRMRTLIHCDYLISLVNMMSLADAIGPAEFKKRVLAFGADKFFLKWNAFTDLHITTFERSSTGEWARSAGGAMIPKRGLGSTQRVRPSSLADLVIGDHVVFFNHLAYDLINVGVGNAWRLENAVLVRRDPKGDPKHDVFLGHGSGHLTTEAMQIKLAVEFNKVWLQANDLIRQAKSGNKKTQADARAKLLAKFPNVKPVGADWRIQGVPGLLQDSRCPRRFDEKFEKFDNLRGKDILGPKSPCDPTKMNEVERPIESAK